MLLQTRGRALNSGREMCCGAGLNSEGRTGRLANFEIASLGNLVFVFGKLTSIHNIFLQAQSQSGLAAFV